MGMVFQHFNLFPHMTVKENITMAPVLLKQKTRQEADDNGHGASGPRGPGGQGRRTIPPSSPAARSSALAIVRALAMEPDVMLFDEPTSALDPEMVGEVLDVMKRAGPRAA